MNFMMIETSLAFSICPWIRARLYPRWATSNSAHTMLLTRPRRWLGGLAECAAGCVTWVVGLKAPIVKLKHRLGIGILQGSDVLQY